MAYWDSKDNVYFCRKSLKKSKHQRLLQDLFSKVDLEVERQPLLETDTRPSPKERPPSKEHIKENMAKRTQPKNVVRFTHKGDSKKEASLSRERKFRLSGTRHTSRKSSTSFTVTIGSRWYSFSVFFPGDRSSATTSSRQWSWSFGSTTTTAASSPRS